MSTSADTQIIISGKVQYKGRISNFIDKLLEDNRANVITIEKDSVVLDLNDDYKIIGVSNEEKTSWKRIAQVSRHPANGGLVKVTTKTGRTTTATLSHSFLKRKEDGIDTIKGSELKVGHRIPVAKYLPMDELFKEYINNYNKLAEKEHELNSNDIIPELSELINEIGNTVGIQYKKDCNNIGREDLINYINAIEQNYNNINNIVNKLNILKQAAYSDILWDEIVNLEYINDYKDYVYDFTVPGNDSFMVDNGVLVHNTLKAFHSSGIAAKGTSTLGVARTKELLSFSKNIKTPQMYIYLNEENMGNSEMANRIASHMKYTTLEQIRRRIDIYYDPYPKEKDGFMDKDNVKNVFYTTNPSKNSCQSDYAKLPWIIRVEMDREKMMEKDVTLLDIKSKFCNDWERRYHDIKSLKKEERSLLEKITQCSVLSNSDNDSTPVLHIRFDMTEISINTMVEFMESKIDSFKIKGVSGIDDILDVFEDKAITFNNPNHELIKKTEYVIYTSGINLMDIRYLHNIDLAKTICNDVITIYETYGIEATRTLLLKEFMTVFERAGVTVNYQHFSLLVDIMTNNGDVTSIDRHGMNRIDSDPLSQASFEKTVDKLIAAAVFNKKDTMRSVSSRIMAGMTFEGGTGYCKLILDAKALELSEYTEEVGQTGRVQELTVDTVVNDIMNQNNEGIFMPF